MEKLLQKLARQLVSIDEASLTQLWNKYQDIVNRFEPTKTWEESVLIFCMIQSVRWKNQLINNKCSTNQKFEEGKGTPALPNRSEISQSDSDFGSKEKGKIIPFRIPDSNEN